MNAPDADAAARVIERLLVDAAFRAEFRRDPANACREAGLDELAEQMSIGSGNAMQTLDTRESRSSLAGVMMAAALEAVGVFEFVEHIVPAAAAAPGAVQDVLSRVNLPAVDPLRGSLAAPPANGPGAAPASLSGATGTADEAPAPAPAPVTPPTPPAGAGDGADDAPASGSGGQEETTGSGDTDNGAGSPTEDGRLSRSAQTDSDPTAPVKSTGSPLDAQGTAGDAPAPAAVDPAQFGAEGSGGAPNAEALALLNNKKVILDPDGIADIKEGKIDPRVVAVLTKLSEKHTIKVSCMCRDHPVNTTGGSVSNHHYGRGMDIAAIDGVPVNAASLEAREVATELGALDQDYQPNEIGTPFQIADPRYFHDNDHNDHIHVAFKQLIDKSWQPPADVAAGGGGGAREIASGAAQDPAAGGAVLNRTLSIAVPERAGAGASAGGTMGMKVAAEQPPGSFRRASAAGAGVAEAAGQGDDRFAGAGPKAATALKEALKYKGTPYLWGGSTPQTGFDCSGLVQWAYAQQGIQIPRVTDQQILASNGDEVKRGELLPGDLVFFRNASGYVHHVGISMGGDKFLHAPHTGDVVKESSLSEAHYAQEFAGGRRFDKASPDAAVPDPAAVAAARAAHARDAAEAQREGTLTFKALTRQEASNRNSTMQFMRAIRPEERTVPAGAADLQRASVAEPSGPLEYPGDQASKSEIAAWMGRKAQEAGLPRELPVMAGLVESGLTNIQGGDRDSVGFFQMRLGIWNKGAYLGYPDNPDLQLKWFIDTALAVKKQRLARGETGFLKDSSQWGNWVADVERPQENLRFKYQLKLGPAQQLLGGSG